MSKRLIMISIVGIVLVGGAYGYINWYKPSQAPAPPPPRPAQQVATPRPPQPPRPAAPAQVQPKPADPAVAPSATGTMEEQPEAPNPGATQAPAPLPPKVTPPDVTTAESPKPAMPPAQLEQPAPKPMAKAPEPTVTVERPYRVQVASLVVEQNALSLKEKLEKLGYSTSILRTTAPITRHRVYAGEFRNRDEAEETARKLGVDGFPANVVVTEQREFALEVGWSFNLDEAIDLAYNLQQKQYRSRIVSQAGPTPVHVVRVGAYEDRSEAVRTSEALRAKGFSPLIVRD